MFSKLLLWFLGPKTYKIPRQLRTWDHEAWPTETGHTYCGFHEVRPGVVVPDNPNNFELIAHECKEQLRQGFADVGCILQEPSHE